MQQLEKEWGRNIMFKHFLAEVEISEDELVAIEGDTRLTVSTWLSLPTAEEFRDAANFMDTAEEFKLNVGHEVVDGDLVIFEVIATQSELKEFVGLLWSKYETLIDLPYEWFA